jgi:hypothetical protein
MKSPRKFDPAIAARLLEARREIDAFSKRLGETTAKELTACHSPKEAEEILERFVAKLIDRLDEEAVRLGLPPNYFEQPRTVH